MITINAKISNDPYYILGIDRDSSFIEVKKQYFLLAKKYHPDLNPNNEVANKMFILIGEAYRQIESDHNPLLKEARRRAAETYDSGPNENKSTFKSRRPENSSEQAFYEGEGSHQERVNDWNEEKFLRRYRVQHLRNNSIIPMSIRNVDRHGLANLAHEPVKAFDRIKIPPVTVYLFIFFCFAYVMMKYEDNEEYQLKNLTRKNLLLAIKKTQDAILYHEDEITPAEQITMKTQQYKEVVEKQEKKEKQQLDKIKSLILTEGTGANKVKKVDLRQ